MENYYETKKISLKNVWPSSLNPRVENIPLDVKGDDFRKKQKYSKEEEKRLLKKIFDYEGVLDSFLDLINSLKKHFNTKLPSPALICSKKDKSNKEYIVIEGNRRVLALKLLNNHIKLPEWDSKRDSISKKVLDDEEVNEKVFNDDENTSLKNKLEIKKRNYKKIKELIKEYWEENNISESKMNEAEYLFKVIKYENEAEEAKALKIEIFTNHITGKSTGKRNWNRGKTLNMYLNYLDSPEDINDEKKFKEKLEKISEGLNRTIENVKENLLSALFIKNLLEKAGEDVNEYYKTNAVSALEKTFVRNFINIGGKNTFDELVKINDKCEIQMEVNWLTVEDFCKFIILAHKKGYLTTRSNTKNNVDRILEWDEFQRVIKRISKASYDKTITKKDSFSSIAKLDIQKLKGKDKEQNIQKVQMAKEIGGELKKLKELLNEKNDEHFFEPTFERHAPIKNAIIKLKEQIQVLISYNGLKNFQNTFFNGLLSATRAFTEVLCAFLFVSDYFFNKIKNLKYKKNENVVYAICKGNKRFFIEKKLWSNDEQFLINTFTKNKNEWIRSGVLTNSTIFVNIIRDLYSNKKNISYVDLNKALSNIEPTKSVEEHFWDKVLSKDRNKMENIAIHSPHFFEKKDELMIKDLKDVLQILTTCTIFIKNIFH